MTPAPLCPKCVTRAAALLNAISVDDSSALPLDFLTDDELRMIVGHIGARACDNRDGNVRIVCRYLDQVGR